MDAVHLHLVLNHIPVIGLGFALATLIVAWVRGDDVLRRLGLAFLVLIALAALGARLTGSGAEDAVEKMPGVTEAVIERHEDSAVVATIVTCALGIAALLGLWAWRRAPVPRWFHAAILAMAIVSGGLMAYTSNLGGQVRHTEIRPASGSAAAPSGSEEGEKDGD